MSETPRERTVGMVVCAFALTPNEPSPTNIPIANEAMRIRDELEAEGYEVLVAAQWENALAMDRVDLTVGPFLDRYLRSDDVVSEGREKLFSPAGISAVVPVAKPGLHLLGLKQVIKKQGFEVMERPIEAIPYRPDSLQWWTRGPAQLFAYTALRVPGLYKGQLFVTDQMRELAGE